jgi:hypothetical protein
MKTEINKVYVKNDKILLIEYPQNESPIEIYNLDIALSPSIPFSEQVDMEYYNSKKLLEISDKDMARVGEDLFDILMSKNILELSDIPEKALEKIQQRKEAREKIKLGFNIITNEEEEKKEEE